jgi:hypothetical protein
MNCQTLPSRERLQDGKVWHLPTRRINRLEHDLGAGVVVSAELTVHSGLVVDRYGIVVADRLHIGRPVRRVGRPAKDVG